MEHLDKRTVARPNAHLLPSDFRHVAPARLPVPCDAAAVLRIAPRPPGAREPRNDSRRPGLLIVLVSVVLTGLMTLMSSTPAGAVPVDEKLRVMSAWTQPSTASFNAWSAARDDQGRWVTYNFDWSTDYCSSSPDRPAGFDFRIPCWHHDWGYRNYKEMQRFSEDNKGRIDSVFYSDMRRVCSGFSGIRRTECNAIAWVYYQAVKIVGQQAVTHEQIDRAAQRTFVPG